MTIQDFISKNANTTYLNQNVQIIINKQTIVEESLPTFKKKIIVGELTAANGINLGECNVLSWSFDEYGTITIEGGV